MNKKKIYILIFLVLLVIFLNFQGIFAEDNSDSYIKEQTAILEKVRQTFWSFISHPYTNIIFGKPVESVSALKQAYGTEYSTLMTISGFIIHFIILLALIFLLGFVFEVIFPFSYKIFPWFLGIVGGVFIGNLNFISSLSRTFGDMTKFFGIWFIFLWVILLFALFVFIITGGNSLKTSILVKRIKIEGHARAGEIANKIYPRRYCFAIFGIFILILSFLISNTYAQDSTPELPLGITPENIEKAGTIVQDVSDTQASSDYLKKEWAKILEKIPVISWINSFLKSISIFFAIVFSEPYTPSFVFFFFIFMWLYLFFKISEMLYDFFPFSFLTSLIVGFILNFFLGHFGIIKAIVNGIDWSVTALKNTGVPTVFIYLLTIVILFLFYSVTSVLGKIYKNEKIKTMKQVKDAEAGTAASVMKRIFLTKN